MKEIAESAATEVLDGKSGGRRSFRLRYFCQGGVDIQSKAPANAHHFVGSRRWTPHPKHTITFFHPVAIRLLEKSYGLLRVGRPSSETQVRRASWRTSGGGNTRDTGAIT